MATRAGSADLPLHGGRVPKWLGERMTRLGAVIGEAIVLLEYGYDEFLRRLAHPFWFQSFGAVLGMDWHPDALQSQQQRADLVRGTVGRKYLMIAALKQTIAIYADDPVWPTVRPPLVALSHDQGKSLAAELDAIGFAMPGLQMPMQ